MPELQLPDWVYVGAILALTTVLCVLVVEIGEMVGQFAGMGKIATLLEQRLSEPALGPTGRKLAQPEVVRVTDSSGFLLKDEGGEPVTVRMPRRKPTLEAVVGGSRRQFVASNVAADGVWEYREVTPV